MVDIIEPKYVTGDLGDPELELISYKAMEDAGGGVGVDIMLDVDNETDIAEIGLDEEEDKLDDIPRLDDGVDELDDKMDPEDAEYETKEDVDESGAGDEDMSDDE